MRERVAGPGEAAAAPASAGLCPWRPQWGAEEGGRHAWNPLHVGQSGEAAAGPLPMAQPASGTPQAVQLPAPVDEGWNVGVNTAHGAVQAIAINLYNPFIGINLLRMGGDNFEVGLISSLPPLAALISNLAGARWLARRADARRTTAFVFALARMLALGLALVDLLVPARHPAWWWPALFVAVFGLLNLPASLGTLGWQALLPGLISGRRRGPALAQRLALAGLVGVTVSLLAGWLSRGQPGMSGYVAIFVLAAAFGVLEGATFLRFRGAPAVQTLPPNLLAGARRLWVDRTYRVFLLSCLPFYLGWLLAWPLFLKYNVSYNHADNLWIGAYTAVNALSGTAGNLLWARVARRIGVAPALALAAFLLAGTPACYLFAPSLWGVMVPQVVGGLGSGFNLLLLLRMMEVAPEADRVVAMAVNNALLGAVGVFGPLVGISLLGPLGLPGVFWVPTLLRCVGGAILFVAAGAMGSSLRRRRRTQAAGA